MPWESENINSAVSIYGVLTPIWGGDLGPKQGIVKLVCAAGRVTLPNGDKWARRRARRRAWRVVRSAVRRLWGCAERA